MLMAFALGTLHLHIYLNGRIQNETVKVRKHWRYTTVRPAPDACMAQVQSNKVQNRTCARLNNSLSKICKSESQLAFGNGTV